jgi:hypothetical protein
MAEPPGVHAGILRTKFGGFKLQRFSGQKPIRGLHYSRKKLSNVEYGTNISTATTNAIVGMPGGRSAKYT